MRRRGAVHLHFLYKQTDELLELRFTGRGML